MKIDRTKTREQLIEELDKLRTGGNKREAELTAANEQLEATNQQLLANEKSLRTSEEKFRAIAEYTFDWEIFYNNKQEVDFVSKAFETITGYKRDDFLAQRLLLESIVHPDDLNEFMEKQHSYLSGECVECFTFRIVDANDEIKHVELCSQPIREASDAIVGVRVSIRDISKRIAFEQALVISKEKFSTYFNSNPSAVFVWKAIGNDFVLVDVNQKALELTNDKAKSFIGSKAVEIYEDLPEIRDQLHQCLETKTTSDFEYFYRNRSLGTRDWHRFRFSFAHPDIILMYADSIQEEKEAEESLRKVHAKYAAMIENIGDVLGIVDVNGIVKYKSPNIEKWFGWKPEDFIGKSGFETSHPEDVAFLEEQFRRLLQKPGATATLEYRYKCKDGTYKWVELNAINCVQDPNIAGILLNYHDISGRRTAEKELKDSQLRFKALHNASFGGIVIHDKGLILDCNQGLSEITGYENDELTGMDGLLLIAEESREKVMGNILSGYEKAYEAVGIRKNGTKYPLRLEARKIPYKGKQVRVVEFRDITEIKNNEIKLQISEEKYRSLYEKAPLAYQSLNIDGNIIDVNPQWLKVLGYNREEVIGEWFGNFLEANSTELFRKRFPVFKAKGSISGAEFKMKRKDGNIIDVSFEGRIGYDESGNFRQTYCTFMEITAQKRAEHERKKSKERLDLALKIGNISICEWMLQGREIHSDGRLEEILGYTNDPDYEKLDMIGRLKLLLHDEDQPFVEELNRLLKQPAGWLLDRTVRYRTSDGERCYWYRSIAKAVESDSEGKARRIIITHLNVDSEKRKELEALETRERVLNADKMATLGTLTAGIAHEINNPNQMILSNAQFLGPFIVNLSENLKEFPEDVVEEFLMGIPIDDIPRRLRTSFANIQGGSQRIKTIVSELKDYVRQKDYDFSAVDLNRVIYSAQTLTSHLGKKMTNYFEWSAEPDLVVWGNFQKLEQVMVNLFVNAYEALNSKSQKVTISSFKDDENVVVKIADEGIGIPKEALGQITDPFFTTKQHQGGTGMGLSVVATVLREHEAEIRFEKNIPQGTCVFIKFPPCEA